MHLGRPGAGGVQAEAAGVAEGIQHAPARRQPRDLLAVVALVEVKAGLLSLGEIDAGSEGRAPRSAIGPSGRPPRKGPSCSSNPSSLADAAFGAQVDAGRLEQVLQQVGEHLAALRQAQAGELHDQPAIVAIDDAAGQAVALAEDEPAGLARADSGPSRSRRRTAAARRSRKKRASSGSSGCQE